MSEMTLAQTRASAQALLDMQRPTMAVPGLARELLQRFLDITGPSGEPVPVKEPMQAGPAEPIMQFFGYAHLPPHLQSVSAAFHSLAQSIVDNLPRNPERTVALRKLLEAKDAAVRAKLYSELFK